MPTESERAKAERRARREARREKQRAANIQRAVKMRAARLAWEAAHPAFVPRKAQSRRRYYIGCSGWFYWDWRGIFYPRGMPTSHWFRHYASQFKTVELNAPFYSWPTVGTVQSWIRQAGHREFVYTVKVCELITHIKRFRGTKILIRDFGHIGDLLGKRLGCFLFQFPPSFAYTKARLRAILSQLDANRRNVIEFRHRSWWNQKVYAGFKRAGIIFCSCSGPRLPDELIKTADDIYIRFHGVSKWYRHDYSHDELKIWAKRIKDSKARRVFAYFNNDYQGHAIKNAKALSRMLGL